MKNYSILAKYYDRFSHNDCDYESWSQYLLNEAKKRHVKTVADIACGTGKMSVLLWRSGLAVTGVDCSEEMLCQAADKCRGVFVLQDMRRLQLTQPVDMAVCVNDGVNYLKPNEVQPFFAELRKTSSKERLSCLTCLRPTSCKMRWETMSFLSMTTTQLCFGQMLSVRESNPFAYIV